MAPFMSRRAAPGRFEIAIDGDPPVEVVSHGLHPEGPGGDLSRNNGMMATAMHCVNAIPATCRAQPGIQTYLDLPLVSGRASAAPHGMECVSTSNRDPPGIRFSGDTTGFESPGSARSCR